MRHKTRTDQESGSKSAEVQRRGKVDRQFITGLSRGLKILEAFRPADEFLPNSQLASRTGLPRPTISRLTHTLCELGYLARGDDRRGYRLHPHVLSLAQPILVRLRVRELARPLMQQLADETPFTVALGVRDRSDMIFIERTRTSAKTTLSQDIGSRVPIPFTSMGRAYLAGMRSRDRQVLLDELSRSTPSGKWMTAKASIDRELARFRRQGYCFGMGEWKSHTCGVGVPLLLPDGSLLSINCGGLCSLMTTKEADRIGERLKKIVKEIVAGQRATR